MMAHTYPNTQEAKSGGLLRAQRQSEIQIEFWVSPKYRVKKKKQNLHKKEPT